MKRWQIRVHYSGSTVVTVDANTKDEAIDKAYDAIDHAKLDINDWDSELEYAPTDLPAQEG